MRKTRERYRVDLLELQAACEANYLRLMRLLPGMRSGCRRGASRSAGVTCCLACWCRGTGGCPYTTTVRVSQGIA